jgi:peptide-methionine (R)-S-oxide reductase
VKFIKKNLVLVLVIIAGVGALLVIQMWPSQGTKPKVTTTILAKEVDTTPPERISGDIESPKTDEEWKKILTPLQFNILREQGTEIPYTSDLLHDAPINPKAVVVREDDTLGVVRMEVLGAKCGGHLGHVFDDGPLPTGLRYCMNGAALKFIPDKEQ